MDFVYSIKRLIDQLFPFYQIGTGLPSTEIRTPVVLPLLYKKTTKPHKKDTAQKRSMCCHTVSTFYVKTRRGKKFT